MALIYVVWNDFIQKAFKNESKLKRLLRFSWSGSISCRKHSRTSQNWKGCFDLRCLVWFHTKRIRKRVKIEKVASIFLVLSDFIQKRFKNRSKLKRLLQFAWSSGISDKTHIKASQNWKGGFDLRGLVCFHTKIIQKRVEIVKFASICVV